MNIVLWFLFFSPSFFFFLSFFFLFLHLSLLFLFPRPSIFFGLFSGFSLFVGGSFTWVFYFYSPPLISSSSLFYWDSNCICFSFQIYFYERGYYCSMKFFPNYL